MSERKVSDPKPSKCGTFKYRIVKIGNKTLGTIEPHKAEDPTEKSAVYWVSSQEVGRLSGGGKTLIFSRPKLIGLSAYGVKKVGLRMADGTSYLAAIDRVTQQLGASVELPVEECDVTIPSEEDRAATLFSKMRLAGGKKRT